MNQTTEPNGKQGSEAREFTPAFVSTMVALTGATLVIVFLSAHGLIPQNDFLPNGSLRQGFATLLHPWIVAGGLTIARGLSEFSGHTAEPLSMATRANLLIGLLLSLVIGPTLYLFGVRKRFMSPQPIRQGPLWQRFSIGYILGGILVFALAFTSVPASVMQRMVDRSLKSAQAVQSDRDQMIYDLNIIAWHARQYQILPKRLEGGDGSFQGFTMQGWIAQPAVATYSLTKVTSNAINLEGQSIKYPNASISVRVDSLGRLGMWTYTGEYM